MEIYKLKNVDTDHIDDVLIKIKRSFDIELDNEGLKDINTLGSLCDIIADKINLSNTRTYTTQQAFYKLRSAIVDTTAFDKTTIKPQTRLSMLFPTENVLQLISEIENESGFKINLLKPRKGVVGLFVLILTASFIGCFYNWQIGVSGLVISVISLKLAGKFGKEIHLKTLGDLANKISKESYLISKRKTCSINKTEIEQKVRALFINELHPEPVLLTRDSTFN